MKAKKLMLSALAVALLVGGSLIYAADHIDSPAVTNQTTDITDVYVFRGETPTNLVFVGNTQGLLSPGATGNAKFDPNTLIEFNIDNNNDKIEDLVIQCIYDQASNRMKVYGPIAPAAPGTQSKLEGNPSVEVGVTPYGASTPVVATVNNIKAFAGPRDDPFFFDLTRFRAILGGTATGFNNPGTDTFAGTNVLSVVVEVPKSLLGNASSINVWLETKKKI
jgi:hypothetical protein